MSNRPTTSSESSDFEVLSVTQETFEVLDKPVPVQVKLCSAQRWTQEMTCLNLAQYGSLTLAQCVQYNDLLLDEPFPRSKLLSLVTLPGHKQCVKLDHATVKEHLNSLAGPRTPVVTQLSLIGHTLTAPQLVEVLTEVGDNLTHLTLRPSSPSSFRWTEQLWDVICSISKYKKLTHLSVAFDREYCRQVRPLNTGLIHLSTYPFGYSSHSEKKLDVFAYHFLVLNSLGLDLSPNTPDSAWGSSDFEHTISILTIATPVDKVMLAKIAKAFKKVESLDITISSEMNFAVCFDQLSKMTNLKHLMIRSNVLPSADYKKCSLWMECVPITPLNSVTTLALKMHIQPLSFAKLFESLPKVNTVFVDQCSYCCYHVGTTGVLPIVRRSVSDSSKGCESCFARIRETLKSVRDRETVL